MPQSIQKINVLLAGDPDKRKEFNSVYRNGSGTMSSTGQCSALLITYKSLKALLGIRQHKDEWVVCDAPGATTPKHKTNREQHPKEQYKCIGSMFKPVQIVYSVFLI